MARESFSCREGGFGSGPLYGAREERLAAARRAIADGQYQLAAVLASAAASRAAGTDTALTTACRDGAARARLGRSGTAVPSRHPRWQLLIASVPSTPSRHRVRVWRRLRQAGAVAVRRSIYVLPDTPTHREAFRKIVQEIQRVGGEAVRFTVDQAEDHSAEALDRLFRGGRGAPRTPSPGRRVVGMIPVRRRGAGAP